MNLSRQGWGNVSFEEAGEICSKVEQKTEI